MWMMRVSVSVLVLGLVSFFLGCYEEWIADFILFY